MSTARLALGVVFLLCLSCKKEPVAPQAPLDLSGSRQGLSAGFIDVDGDGLADKVVGAPYAELDGHLGAALVYRATAEGFEVSPTTQLSGPDLFGQAQVALDDVDGDGRRDFAVSALAGGDDCALSGAVTIFRGGTGGEVHKTLCGGQPSSKFGYSLAAGDLNGDGRTDLVVGAPFESPSAALYQAGAVYVYLSPAFDLPQSLLATASHKGLGLAVAVGDVNGDGAADLLLSATGEVLGFYGGAGFLPSGATPDVILKSSLGAFGQALAVAGDLDGDGKSELLVGAAKSVVGGLRDTGSVFVVRGGVGARNVNLDAVPASADLLLRLDGPGLFARFGAALAAMGDVDGDGRPDFVVGAPLADAPGVPLAGQAYFFRGKDVGPTATLASATAFLGTVRSSGFGAVLVPASGGRLLIGAPRSFADTGGVFVIDVASGRAVTGGATGGATGGEVCCHEGGCDGGQ